jgi:hypothetical protein
MGAPARTTAALAALLKDQDIPWDALRIAPAELLEACAEEELTSLVHQSLHRRRRETDWPEDVREGLAREARADAARELLRQREIVSALDALAAEGLHPILMKGTPLAYSVYEIPSARPRLDTDLLVPREQVDAVRRVMTGLGYSERVHCGGELLLCQFMMEKTDACGGHHKFDIHWKISTQSVFADVLTHDEIAAGEVPIAALGRRARAAGPIHALFLACIHPAMHHRNAERLIWTYDIHLLASGLSAAKFDRFADLVVIKEVAGIVEHRLALAQSLFNTSIPARVTTRLAAPRPVERSAVYLHAGRRWHNELVSSLSGLPRWRDRLKLLREVLLPEPSYMVRVYGITTRSAAMLALPLLYVHRGIYGAWKVVSGRK